MGLAGKLEDMVSKAFDSLAKAENKIVNSAFASRFAIKHPLGAAAAVGAATFSLLAVPDIIETSNVGLYFHPSMLTAPIGGVITGAFLYYLASSHRIVNDAGLSTDRIYELSNKLTEEKADSGLLGIIKRALNPAVLLTSAFLALATYIGHVREIPAETLIQLELAATPILYLSSRRIANNLKSFKLLKTSFIEMYAFFLSNLIKNKKMAIKAFEKLAKDNPSPTTNAYLADMYIDAGQLDQGILKLKEILDDTPRFSVQQTAIAKIVTTAFAYRDIRNNTAKHAAYVYFARTCQSIGENEKAKETMERMTEKLPSIESDILAAMFLETLGKKTEAEIHWNMAVSSIYSDPNTIARSMSEPGVHHVWRPELSSVPAGLAGILWFKSGATPDEPTFAKNVIAYARTTARNSRINLPQFVTEFVHRNGEVSYDLVLRYDEGQSLREMKENDTLTEDDLMLAVESQPWLHKNIPPSLSVKGKVDLYNKLEQRLQNEHFVLRDRPDLVDSITHHIQHILDRQADSPFAFAGDMFPSKYHFGSGGMTVLDWEDKGVTSIFEDQSRFYIDPRFRLETDEVDKLHKHAAALYKENGIFANDSDFRLRLLEGMLLQRLLSASIWSNPEMEYRRDKRLAVLEEAANTFDMIRQNHWFNYGREQSNYDALEGDFGEVQRLLVA